VAQALRDFSPVNTSRPTPAALLEAYEKAAAAGAHEIVSIHLSGEMSGTFESAQLAAREATVPVHAVDSKQLGMGTGYAVLTAADVLDGGGSAAEAADAALARAEATTSLFYVDTLEYLRRGGRIGAAAALLGSALSVKPLLRLDHGRIATLEKVRTSSRALSRLEELAVAAAEDEQIDVAVAHLANPEQAELLADKLRERLATNLSSAPTSVPGWSRSSSLHAECTPESIPIRTREEVFHSRRTWGSGPAPGLLGSWHALTEASQRTCRRGCSAAAGAAGRRACRDPSWPAEPPYRWTRRSRQARARDRLHRLRTTARAGWHNKRCPTSR
jgi:DegV family protein with EDD domain